MNESKRMVIETICDMEKYRQGTNPDHPEGKWEWELRLEAGPRLDITREEWGPDPDHPEGIWSNEDEQLKQELTEEYDREREIFTTIEPITIAGLEQDAAAGGWESVEDMLDGVAVGEVMREGAYRETSIPLSAALPPLLWEMEVRLWIVIGGRTMIVGPFPAFVTEAGVIYTNSENFC